MSCFTTAINQTQLSSPKHFERKVSTRSFFLPSYFFSKAKLKTNKTIKKSSRFSPPHVLCGCRVLHLIWSQSYICLNYLAGALGSLKLILSIHTKKLAMQTTVDLNQCLYNLPLSALSDLAKQLE